MSHLLIIHVAALLCVWYLTTYFIADKEENYALVRCIVVKKRNTEKSLSGTGDNFGKLSGFYVGGVGYSWKTFNLCMLHANDKPNHILRFTNFIPSCCNLHVAAFQLHPTNQKQQPSQDPAQSFRGRRHEPMQLRCVCPRPQPATVLIPAFTLLC